ncbi:MAG: class I SAM-dependent methyltransferase [Desulfovibrio sp.]|nr:class I SAM-dependent methyltransferase [Desulfovibrio sp.]
MKPDYGSWIPRWLVCAAWAGTMAALLAACSLLASPAWGWKALGLACAGLFLYALRWVAWLVKAYRAFSCSGSGQVSRRIVEKVAELVDIPEGGTGLDIGCGSGALTIACARRTPHARMVGCDSWGKKYAYSISLCRANAEAEGVANAEFQRADARRLCFPDASFDAVTSNYVFHNIAGAKKQDLLMAALRVLKPGGVFAIHDLMGERAYCDMNAFLGRLCGLGYAEARLIDIMNGEILSAEEARSLKLEHSMLLVGRK